MDGDDDVKQLSAAFEQITGGDWLKFFIGVCVGAFTVGVVLATLRSDIADVKKAVEDMRDNAKSIAVLESRLSYCCPLQASLSFTKTAKVQP